MVAKTTSLKLDAELRDRIDRLAEAKDRSAHWIMKRAIEEYVERGETEEEFRARALASWEDYERTGLHLTNEEVTEWLERIIAGENPPMPEPHT